ncbi:hypothetical protein TNCV_292301 [Trichonephila clavipes]|nr:hypothetical protein TNCV_292301 [Trichonephila clavipes]
MTSCSLKDTLLRDCLPYPFLMASLIIVIQLQSNPQFIRTKVYIGGVRPGDLASHRSVGEARSLINDVVLGRTGGAHPPSYYNLRSKESQSHQNTSNDSTEDCCGLGSLVVMLTDA